MKSESHCPCRTQLSEYLESVLLREENRNKVDYTSMLGNLQKQDMNETLRLKKVKKYKEHNYKWKKNLMLMKEKVDDDFHTKIMKRSESMKSKGNAIKKLLEENHILKEKQMALARQKMDNAFEQIKENNMKRAQSIEEFRHKTEIEVFDKINKISSSKQALLTNIKQKYTAISTKNMQTFTNQFRQVKEQEREKQIKLKEQAFDKYAKYYEHMKLVRAEERKKKQKFQELEHRKEEILEELEENRLKMSDSILKNIKKIDQRNVENAKVKVKETEEKADKFRKTCRSYFENRRSISFKQEVKNKDNITKQMNLIFNQTTKDTTQQSMKSTLYEKSLVGHIEMEKQVREFYKRLDHIKQRSVTKLNSQEQMNIYLELKREKEEARKKALEEAKAKNS